MATNGSIFSWSSRNREEIKGVWGKKTFPPKIFDRRAGEARHRPIASAGERAAEPVAAGDGTPKARDGEAGMPAHPSRPPQPAARPGQGLIAAPLAAMRQFTR